MTQAIPDAATQAPFLAVTADLGDRPKLRSVGGYLDALGSLADYGYELAMAKAATGPSFNANYSDVLRELLDEEGVAGGWSRRRSGFRRLTRPGEGIAVHRLRLASPLEAVLVAAASDVKPLGYAVVAMALLKSGLGTLMDWQKHRAELRTSYPTSAEVERAQVSEQSLPTIVVVDMQRAAGMPPDGTKEQELIRAVQILSGFPLVRVQADVTPPPESGD